MASLSNVVNIILDLLLCGNEYLTPHMSHLILSYLLSLDTLKNHDDFLCETKLFKICAVIELSLKLNHHRVVGAVADFLYASCFVNTKY